MSDKTYTSNKNIISLSKNKELLPTRSSDTKLLNNPKDRLPRQKKIDNDQIKLRCDINKLLKVEEQNTLGSSTQLTLSLTMHLKTIKFEL